MSVDVSSEGRAYVEVHRYHVLAGTVDQGGQHAPDFDDIGRAAGGIEPFAAVPGLCGEGGKGVLIVEGLAYQLGSVTDGNSIWKKGLRRCKAPKQSRHALLTVHSERSKHAVQQRTLHHITVTAIELPPQEPLREHDQPEARTGFGIAAAALL